MSGSRVQKQQYSDKTITDYAVEMSQTRLDELDENLKSPCCSENCEESRLSFQSRALTSTWADTTLNTKHTSDELTSFSPPFPPSAYYVLTSAKRPNAQRQRQRQQPPPRIHIRSQALNTHYKTGHSSGGINKGTWPNLASFLRLPHTFPLSASP